MASSSCASPDAPAPLTAPTAPRAPQSASIPRRQLKQKRDTRIPARVIDRLRLRTIHARKIRCTKQESLPTSPTTEHLRLGNPSEAPRNPEVDHRSPCTCLESSAMSREGHSLSGSAARASKGELTTEMTRTEQRGVVSADCARRTVTAGCLGAAVSRSIDEALDKAGLGSQVERPTTRSCSPRASCSSAPHSPARPELSSDTREVRRSTWSK